MSALARHGTAGDGPERVVVKVLDQAGNPPVGHHLEERGGNRHRVRRPFSVTATGSRCTAS